MSAIWKALKILWLSMIKWLKWFFNFIKEESNTIVALTTIISLIYVVYSTRKNIQMVQQTVNQAQEQLILQKKSIPAQFIMTYDAINTYNEQAFITNTGKTQLLNVTAEFEYYFIFPDDKVLSALSIQSKVINNDKLFRKIQSSGLINFPDDFKGLFGTSRIFYLSQLDPQKRTLLEISSSSVQNAIKLNEVLDTKLFKRWKIKYNEELSNKEIASTIFIWINDLKKDEHSISNYSKRENLKNVIGGKRIREIIEFYEETSNEIIF